MEELDLFGARYENRDVAFNKIGAEGCEYLSQSGWKKLFFLLLCNNAEIQQTIRLIHQNYRR